MIIIKLSEVALRLNYKKTISAEKWCINNGLYLITYHGTRGKFVVEEHFEWVRWRKYIINDIIFNDINNKSNLNSNQDEACKDEWKNIYHEKRYKSRLLNRLERVNMSHVETFAYSTK